MTTKILSKFESIWNQVRSISPTRIEEKRLLFELHGSWLFRFGIIFRVLFILLCIPLVQKLWFITFITNSLQFSAFDPWTTHVIAGGDEMAFPYGYMMYLTYLPLTALGWGMDQSLEISYFSKVGFGFTSLFLDYGILIGIAFLLRKYSPKLLLLSYWCSPIVLYIFYWHGQIDALPVCLLVWGIVQLQRERPVIAGLLLGMAMSAKLSMLAAIPFILIFLYRNRRLRKQLPALLGSTVLTAAISVIPLLRSTSFVKMVFQTPEAERLFTVFLRYGPDIKLFLLPTAYVLTLYLVWRLEKITLDLFLISVGLGFFALLLLLPPAPGWFLWVMPFLVFYQIRSQDEYLLTTVPFFCIYLIYNLLYSTGANIHLLDLETSQPIANSIGLGGSKLKSAIFTGLQSAGLVVCIRMYLFGILRNNYYRGFRRRLGIGIATNQIANKDRLVTSLGKIFGLESISLLNVFDYKKWDQNHPIRSSSALLNPNTYNLSRLTRDLFTLAEGKPIWQNNVRNSNSGRLHKIMSNDLILVSGLHSFYIKRLRERLDLKISLEIDQDLKDYFSDQGHISNFNLGDFPSSGDQIEYSTLVETQACFADLSFRLSSVNSITLKDFNNTGRLPRLKLQVTMKNGFFHEELIHSLIGLCGMHIEVEQTFDLDKISFWIEGDATGEDIEQIANLLIPNLEDLTASQPDWQEGYDGLIQLITLAHISDLLHESRYRR